MSNEFDDEYNLIRDFASRTALQSAGAAGTFEAVAPFVPPPVSPLPPEPMYAEPAAPASPFGIEQFNVARADPSLSPDEVAFAARAILDRAIQIEQERPWLAQENPASRVVGNVLGDAFAIAGQMHAQVNPVSEILLNQLGTSNEEIARFGGHLLNPIPPTWGELPLVGVEFVPGVGSVPDAARAVRGGARAFATGAREAAGEGVERFATRVAEVAPLETAAVRGTGFTTLEPQVPVSAIRRAPTPGTAAASGSPPASSLPGGGSSADVPATNPAYAQWRTLESANLTGAGAQNIVRQTGETLAGIAGPENLRIRRVLAAIADQVSGLDRLIKTAAGPAALARAEPVLRAGVTYKLFEYVQNATLASRLARFEADMPFQSIGGGLLSDIPLARRFAEPNVGRVRLADDSIVAFGDVAENPARYELTPKQQRWIEDGWKLVDDFTDELEAVTGKSLRDEEADLLREHFWPRFVADEQGHVGIRRPIGIKQSPVLERFYETMEDGIADKARYASPLETLQLFGQAMQKMIRDETLKRVMKEDKIVRTVSQFLDDKIADLRGSLDFLDASSPEKVATAQNIWGRIQKLERSRHMILEAHRGEARGAGIGPSFSNIVFKRKEDFTALKAIVTGMGPPGLIRKPTEFANAFPRFVVTGSMDAGQLLIQGQTLLVTSPGSWAEGFYRGLQNMAAPAAYRRWLTTPEPQAAMADGINPGFSEFTELSNAGLIKRLPLVGSRGFLSIPRSFDGFLGGARIHKQQAMKRAAGVTTGSEEAYRIARYVDTLLGVPNMAGLGVSAGQRWAESTWLLYSPRYTRSILGLVGYAFGRGATANDARGALATMLVAGAGTFYGIAKLSGMAEEEIQRRLNPQAGADFLSIRVGDNEYGIGGGYRAMLQMLGGLTVNDNWDFDSWGDGLLGNPVVRYLRGRTAPVSGSLIDFITGEDFFGREVSLAALFDDPARLQDYGLDHYAPQLAQALIEARGDWDDALLTAGVAGTGGRSRPVAAGQLATEAIENQMPIERLVPANVAPGLRDLPFDQWGPREREAAFDWLEQNEPELYKERLADRRERDNVFQQAQDKQTAAFERQRKELDGLAKGLTRGTRDEVQQVMERADDLRNMIRGAGEEIRASQEYQDAVKGLDVNDVNRYLALWHALPDRAKKPNGTTDWDKVEKARQVLLQRVSAEDPVMASRIEFNAQSAEADHTLFRLMDQVSKRSDAYFAKPEGLERQIYLAKNPELNALRWLLGYNGLYSAEAIRLAKRYGPGRKDIKLSELQ